MKHILSFSILSLLLISGCTTQRSTWDVADRRVSSGAAPQELARPAQYNPEDFASGGIGPHGQRQALPAAAVQARPDMMNAQTPPVKVGLLLPLSGPSEALGQSMLQAAQLALFDLGADTFELMPRDTEGTPEGARAAAQAAVNNGAQILLGPLFSGSIDAVRPVARRSSINMVSFSTDWSKAGGNVFLMGFTPFGQVERITAYAARQGLTRIAAIVPSDAYGRAVEEAFSSAARRHNVQVVDIIRLPPGQVSSATMQSFARLSQGTPDAVLIGFGGREAAQLSNMLDGMGMNAALVKRLGTGLWDDPALAAEPSLQGSWLAAPSLRLRQRFEQNYQAFYGIGPSRLASLAYDATALTAVLGKMGQLDATGTYRPAYDRVSLSNNSGFAGIDGVFRFGRNGLAQRQLAVLEFSDARLIEIDAAASRF